MLRRQLPYLEAVVLETLRLRPPAYMVGRCASRPVSLAAAQGEYRLPAGAPNGQPAVLCEVIGEPIKRLAYLIGEPIKLTAKQALRKALPASHPLGRLDIDDEGCDAGKSCGSHMGVRANGTAEGHVVVWIRAGSAVLH